MIQVLLNKGRMVHSWCTGAAVTLQTGLADSQGLAVSRADYTLIQYTGPRGQARARARARHGPRSYNIMGERVVYTPGNTSSHRRGWSGL